MPRWTLEELIDFEQALASNRGIAPDVRQQVAEIGKADGKSARREGFKIWLESVKENPGAGRRFSGALSLVAFLLGAFAWVAGVTGVVGLLDRTRGGMDVVLFMAVLLGLQWLVLVAAVMGWLFRRRTGEAFSSVQVMAGRLLRKLSGEDADRWWYRLVDGGPAPRAALLWRIARLAQGAGICFNLGIICGLAGLVMVRNVGFFWETTTESAMREVLGNTVQVLSFPWSGFWSDAVPDGGLIDSSRWLPGREGMLPPGPAAWWLFLLMSVFVWGLVPRAVLWLLAAKASAAALDAVDFQARHHRVLWRELAGVDRVQTEEKPLDGVLVLDVGGSGFSADALRPFLLQKLRVHPASWHSTAVLDPGAEKEAAAALAQAPAGVVLLAEGWALSPARMTALHSQIRKIAGVDVPVKFLAANEAEGLPVVVSDEEKSQWERFVDSLRDPQAEVYFFT